METILLGNGINRFLSKEAFSWEGLLINLWQKYTNERITGIPLGITFLEFADLLTVKLKNNFTTKDIKKEICSLTELWEQNINSIEKRKINLIRKKFSDSNIITTNYDNLLENILSYTFNKNYRIKGFSYTYPWVSYFANPTNSKNKIWHIHGTNTYSSSIRIGFTDYKNAISKADKLIKDFRNNKPSDYYKNSFLYHFFNDDLKILGFALGTNEIFIRWLLFEKAKYFSKTKVKYYCTDENIDECNLNSFLIEKLGYEIEKYKDYETMYKNI